MKRTSQELARIRRQNVELNRFGHVKRTDKSDERSGMQRDRDAGLKLSGMQLMAERHPWAKVANLLSAARAPLAAFAIWQISKGNYEVGYPTLLAAGLTDAEGNQARASGTDDQTGAAVDTIADAAAAGAVGFGVVAGGLVSPWAVTGIYGPKAINAVNAAVAKRDGTYVYTDKWDKAVEFGRWIGTGVLLAAPAFRESSETVTKVGYVSAGALALTGFYGSWRQIQRRRRALGEQPGVEVEA